VPRKLCYLLVFLSRHLAPERLGLALSSKRRLFPGKAGVVRIRTRESVAGPFCSSCLLIFTLRVNSVCYRRYCLQKLGRALKTPTRILLQEHLKEKGDRLGDVS
jgi:hypothetical protein